jgi:hypothetical protein
VILAEERTMEIRVSLAALRRWLAAGLVVMAVAGVGEELGVHLLGWGNGYGLVRLVCLSEEGNLPTWYSANLLALCSLLLAMVAAGKRGQRHHRHWQALAIIFLYISIDEAVCIHEMLNQFIDLPGIFYFGWVIPAGVLVTIFWLSYLRFLIELPARTRLGFLISGATYVGGALGVELVLGYWSALHGTENLGYGLIDALEETLEMLGASMFIYTLATVLAGEGRSFHIAFSPPRPPESQGVRPAVSSARTR